jgi:hypothetical protein
MQEKAEPHLNKRYIYCESEHAVNPLHKPRHDLIAFFGEDVVQTTYKLASGSTQEVIDEKSIQRLSYPHRMNDRPDHNVSGDFPGSAILILSKADLAKYNVVGYTPK